MGYRKIEFRFSDPDQSSRPQTQQKLPVFKGIPTVFFDKHGKRLRAPKVKYIGFERHAKLKEITLLGQTVYYYEYPSGWDGRNLRIEVISGPDELVGWVSHKHKGVRARNARQLCIEELKRKAHEIEVAKKEAEVTLEAGNTDEDAAETDVNQKQECKEDAKAAVEAAGDEVKEKKDKKAKKQKRKEQKKNPTPKDSTVKDRIKELGRVANAAGKKYIQEGAERLKNARGHLQDSNLSRKQAKALQKMALSACGDTVEFESNGKKYTLTKPEAAALAEKLNIKAFKAINTAIGRSIAGRMQSAIGRGLESGAKQFGKEVDDAKQNAGDCFGVYAAQALLNRDQYNDLGEAVLDVGGKTIQGTTVQAVQNIALESFKGLASEVAPKLAEKIPGINVLNATYYLGKSAYKANNLEEAAGNVINAGADLTIQMTCAVAVQTLVPVPVVGAFLGSLAGGIVVSWKNQLIA